MTFDLIVTGTPRPGQAAAVAQGVASVPQWFRWADPGNGVAGQAVWLMAGQESWPNEALRAVQQGARIVIVDQPRCVNPEAISLLAASATPVILLTGTTHSPQIRAWARLLAAQAAPIDWLDLVTVVADDGDFCPRGALFAALATLTAAGLTPTSVPRAIQGPGALMVDLAVGPAQWHLSAIHGPNLTPKTVVKAFGTFGSLEVTLLDTGTAFPGEVVLVNGDGVAVVPTDYQTPRRVALHEAYTYLVDGLIPPCWLTAFTPIAHLVDQVVWGSAQPAEHPLVQI